jgi:hypothetical protein
MSSYSKARKGYSEPLARELIHAWREQDAEQLRVSLALTVAERDELAERAKPLQADRVGCSVGGTFARAKYMKRPKCKLKRKRLRNPPLCERPPAVGRRLHDVKPKAVARV